MQYIPRIIESHLKEALWKGKVLVVYGPRQVGKTTMVREIIKNIDGSSYFSCDDPDIRGRLEHKNTQELRNFVLGKRLVVFDEAQRVRDIGLSLKLLHDAYPSVQIIATGSSSFELTNKTKEALTGRSLEYTLFPLSFVEIAQATSAVEAENLTSTMLVYGMYPWVLFGELDRRELLGTIAGQYLYKDILQFEGIRMPELLEKILKLLAVSVGSEVSYNELSNTLGASRKTVETYIRYLEQAFIIYRVLPFSGNIRSQVTKKQKIYFVDTGMRNALLGAFGDVPTRLDKGQLWENFVVIERKKMLANRRDLFAKQFFLRTYDGQEVNLIEETGGPHLAAFEIKYKLDKKYSAPPVWRKHWGQTPVKAITRENISQFLLEV